MKRVAGARGTEMGWENRIWEPVCKEKPGGDTDWWGEREGEGHAEG